MIVCVFAAGCGYLGFRIRQDHRRFVPSAAMDSLEKLGASAIPTEKLVVVGQGKNRQYVWFGRTVIMGSGPPMLVFDSSGNVVNRSADVGDSSDDGLRYLFGASREAKALTIREALAQIAPGERK